MSHLIAAILGILGLCTALFLYLCLHAPMDTDLWDGGEPR